MADGRAGDEVRVADGTARVVCVVQSTHPSNDLVRMGELEITPRHPIRVDGTWTLPTGDPASGSTVYNFVLDRCHVLLVNGVECVTLGHGLTDPVVAHPYYGDKIVDDLKKLASWESGLVNIEFCVRDGDGHCVGLVDRSQDPPGEGKGMPLPFPFTGLITGLIESATEKPEDQDSAEASTEASTEVELEVLADGNEVVVRAVVPDAAERAPVDVACVVDISGSMGVRATYEEDGQVRSDGLTTLDIVRHAVKAVMGNLGEADRLAIIAFDNKAETAFPLAAMSAEGRAMAEEALERLAPRGQTNLWAGLVHGLDALRDGDGEDRKKTILLLTDGQPNIKPPRGHLAELKKYRETNADFSCQISTFGFGYKLDSQLLLELAEEGQGTFGFIPDAPMVGTCFVDAIANVLSTHTPRALLHLTPGPGGAFAGPVKGGFSVMETEWGRVVDIGSLQLGQSREVVVPMAFSGPGMYLEAFLEYGDSVAEAVGTDRTKSAEAEAAVHRARAIDALDAAFKLATAGNLDEAHAVVGAVVPPASSDERLNALAGDLNSSGRAIKAMTGMDRFNRWGKHYLRALRRAHQVQQCTNFVDPGVQVYGGALFAQLRKAGDELFLALPPPRPAQPPSRERPVASASASRQAPARSRSPSPAVDMNRYYDSFGGCFGAQSEVVVVTEAGDVSKKVTAVRSGEEVRVADGTARVVCVVRSAHPSSDLVRIGELEVTAKHPIRVDGKWTLPVGEPVTGSIVYNFVLDRCHVLMVNGVECVTLGHGLTEPGVAHPYYGNRILRDLTQLPGWSTGLVNVEFCVRDVNGHCIGLTAMHDTAPVQTCIATAQVQIGVC
jgi:Mg-chelatase subunit ChlD